jgi:hypothetical protein
MKLDFLESSPKSWNLWLVCGRLLFSKFPPSLESAWNFAILAGGRPGKTAFEHGI